MIVATVFFWTTATSAFARRPFPFPCSASGSAPLSCPLTKNCMQISTPRRTGGVVKCAARPLLQAQTASNTARTAGNALPADRQPSASGNGVRRLRNKGEKSLDLQGINSVKLAQAIQNTFSLEVVVLLRNIDKKCDIDRLFCLSMSRFLFIIICRYLFENYIIISFH